MKALSQYSIRKSFTLLSIILFSTLMFTSCEKVEDEYKSNTTSNTVIEGRTEMVIVNESDWQMIDGKMSAYLPSVFYNADQEYEYLKIYSEESDNSKSEGDYNWVEMPNSKYTFMVEGYEIFVQSIEGTPKNAQFLIAIKVI